MPRRWCFVNCKRRHTATPTEWQAPTLAQLRAVSYGDFVKILPELFPEDRHCNEMFGERLWARVEQVLIEATSHKRRFHICVVSEPNLQWHGITHEARFDLPEELILEVQLRRERHAA